LKKSHNAPNNATSITLSTAGKAISIGREKNKHRKIPKNKHISSRALTIQRAIEKS
jgi:hypothetical protein